MRMTSGVNWSETELSRGPLRFLVWYCSGMVAAVGADQALRLPKGLLSPDALPLYDQVAAKLLADIAASEATPGDRLPSERSLCSGYEVSRVTLRSALRRLEDRGVIGSLPSRGWYVRERPHATVESRPNYVLGFSDSAALQGLVSTSRVLSREVRPCTFEEAEPLRIAAGAPLFDLRRMRFLDGLVIALERNRLPVAVCPFISDVDFDRESLYQTLRTMDPPRIPSVADYSVEARTASTEEEELLEITQPVPLLVATQLAFDQQGVPIEFTKACYRGDRYRFRASIGSQRQ